MTPSDALLSLLADLKMQLVERDAQVADLAAQVADLRRHLDTCPANQEPTPPA